MPISPPGSSEASFTPVGRSAEHGFEPIGRAAEHGFEPVGRSAEHGFTLVELMVTITVVALTVAAVVWAMPDPRGRVRDDALRFAARVRAARDEAVATGAPVSVWVNTGGYGFDRLAGRTWVAMGDKPLGTEPWAGGAVAELGDASGRLRVTFDPTGLPDRGADVRLALKGRAMLVRIGGDGSVRADAQ